MLDEKTLEQIIDLMQEGDIGYIVSGFMIKHGYRLVEFKSTTQEGIYIGECHLDTQLTKY